MLFSKSGNEFTSRYPAVASAVAKLPTKSVVLDAELTACASDGSPDFDALLRKRTDSLCVWVFDILFHNGKDLRLLTYVERRTRLETLLLRAKSPIIRYSETFADPIPLLSACQSHGLEGIVSKRIDRPYRSGPGKTQDQMPPTGGGITSGGMSSSRGMSDTEAFRLAGVFSPRSEGRLARKRSATPRGSSSPE
jgi:ATP-dependent DNA ligase